jgi:hypothetical protein
MRGRPKSGSLIDQFILRIRLPRDLHGQPMIGEVGKREFAGLSSRRSVMAAYSLVRRGRLAWPLRVGCLALCPRTAAAPEASPFEFNRAGKLRGAQGFDAECDRGRIRSAVVHLVCGKSSYCLTQKVRSVERWHSVCHTSPMGHVWTAPAVQEESDSQRNVRVQSCIRPLNAAVLAAGPDVIR